MKKKKLAASLLLAGALAAQAGMPVLAAYNADNNPYGNQHTTFGVKETDATQIQNQVSFQIPLYVTVVAIKGESGNMGVPNNYIIKNTGNGDTTIGVTKVTAEHLGSDWSVIEGNETVAANKMHFSIGGLDVAQKQQKNTGSGKYEFAPSNLEHKGDINVLFDATAEKTERAKVLEAAETTQFVKKVNAKNQIYPLAANEENNLKLLADTEKNAARTEKSTVAVFKVVYTVAALDGEGNPITTATPYAGEDAAQAGYKNGNVTNGKN